MWGDGFLNESRDADGDGIPDWWEQQYCGSITNCAPGADTDGDGMSNLFEYLADTNPTNALPVLRFSRIAPQAKDVRLEWQGGVAARQFLERSRSIGTAGTNWVGHLHQLSTHAAPDQPLRPPRHQPDVVLPCQGGQRIVLERLSKFVYSDAMKTVIDYVRRWAEGEPFRPFTLRLEDGRAIPVTRLAHIACSDSGETVAVFLPDGSLEIIAQKSVTFLQEARA